MVLCIADHVATCTHTHARTNARTHAFSFFVDSLKHTLIHTQKKSTGNPCSVLGASSIKAACRSNRQRMLLNENVPLAEQNAALKLLKPWRSEPLPTDLLPPSPSVDVEASCSSSRPPWEVSTPSRGGSVPLGAADPVIPSPKEQLRARANSSEEEHFAQALEWIRNPGLGRDGEKHVILSRVFMNEERVGKLQEALSQSSSGVSHLDFSRLSLPFPAHPPSLFHEA